MQCTTIVVRDARFTTKSGSVAQANHASAMSRAPLASKLERSAHLIERVNERALNRLGFKPMMPLEVNVKNLRAYKCVASEIRLLAKRSARGHRPVLRVGCVLA